MSLIQLDRDCCISGYVQACYLDEPEYIFGRTEDLYSVTIIPDDPYLAERILELFEEIAGPDGRRIDPSDLIRKDGTLKFESILKPQRCEDENGFNLVQHGSWADIDIRIEHSTSMDGEIWYPRLVLRRALPHVDPNDLINWDDVPETYSF